MSYSDIRAECEGFGAVKRDDVGDICGLSGCVCNGKNCPSKAYWAKGHKQPGYYRQRALDRTGLAEQYAEEIG